jgi:hypothetical protein
MHGLIEPVIDSKHTTYIQEQAKGFTLRGHETAWSTPSGKRPMMGITTQLPVQINVTNGPGIESWRPSASHIYHSLRILKSADRNDCWPDDSSG